MTLLVFFMTSELNFQVSEAVAQKQTFSTLLPSYQCTSWISSHITLPQIFPIIEYCYIFFQPFNVILGPLGGKLHLPGFVTGSYPIQSTKWPTGWEQVLPAGNISSCPWAAAFLLPLPAAILSSIFACRRRWEDGHRADLCTIKIPSEFQ